MDSTKKKSERVKEYMAEKEERQRKTEGMWYRRQKRGPQSPEKVRMSIKEDTRMGRSN